MDDEKQSQTNGLKNPEIHKGKYGVKKSDIWEIIKFTIIALVIVVPIRLFIAQPFIVSGESMAPTFENGDYLIIDEVSYRFNEPERGDVIVFRYPQQPERFFIKRIIGLPTERIQVNNNIIRIYEAGDPSGFILDEKYLQGVETSGNKSVLLKEDEFFVMGDNRPDSSDSRAWGPLGKHFIVGRAWVRLFPFKEIDFLPGQQEFTNLDN